MSGRHADLVAAPRMPLFSALSYVTGVRRHGAARLFGAAKSQANCYIHTSIAMLAILMILTANTGKWFDGPTEIQYLEYLTYQ
jgi:uncharacterized ion transporter superfamily protein YfcC